MLEAAAGREVEAGVGRQVRQSDIEVRGPGKCHTILIMLHNAVMGCETHNNIAAGNSK